MWTDNETDIDFLNFSGVAKTAAAMIRQVQPKPVSIGVSGAWGVGKSSLIKLIRNELLLDKSAPKGLLSDQNTFVFVEFNAWLYQGYEMLVQPFWRPSRRHYRRGSCEADRWR